MKLLHLFFAATFPVLKVILVTAVGSVLAIQRIGILGDDAKKHLNNVVFYVFNPALIATYLAKTLTLKTIATLWFMPLNILLAFIMGSVLGWVVIQITKPPQRLRALILGCCSAGNLGNIFLIIIPAICKEKGSPFGASDVCQEYGMAYVSLSLAIGSIYLWSYVYNVMRVSSNKSILEAEMKLPIDNTIKETSELSPKSCIEAPPPPKDGFSSEDNAGQSALTFSKSDENVKQSSKAVETQHLIGHLQWHGVENTLFGNCWQTFSLIKFILRFVFLFLCTLGSAVVGLVYGLNNSSMLLVMLGHMQPRWHCCFSYFYVMVPCLLKFKHLKMPAGNNLKKLFSPSIIAAIVGLFIGVVPQIRSLLIGDSAPLRVIQDSFFLLGQGAIPCVSLVLGVNLTKGLKGSGVQASIIVGVVLVRYALLPLFGILIVKGATHIGLIHSDPLYRFVLLLQFAVPPAMNIGTITQLFGVAESECSIIMLWTYALATVSLTLWSILFMWLVS